MKTVNMKNRTPHHHSLFWMLLEQLFWSKFHPSSTRNTKSAPRSQELFDLKKVFQELKELEDYVKTLP